MLKYSCRRFGLLSGLVGIFNAPKTGYIIGTYPPHRSIPDHNTLVKEDTQTSLHLTTLPNGVRIVSEVGGYPGSVHLGVSLNAGTRDETQKNSGVVHALEKTYLKTNVRTNEQINYAMVQMSGGAFSMNYNQEFLNYSGYFLAHDTYELLQLLSDTVLDEKTIMDEEAAQWRIDHYWKLRDVTITPKARLDELWLSTAYGYTGYGMPLSGFESNFQNLGYYYLNLFRKTYITPDRIIVWGAGIQSHEELVDAASPYFHHIDSIKGKPRAASQYIGGDFRELADLPATHVSLSFHGFSSNDPSLYSASVLKNVIGKSNTGVHNRANTHFHEKYEGLLYLEPDQVNFEDTGNFKINFAASNDKIQAVAEGVIKELQDLANITEQEVTRAKNSLIRTTTREHLNPAYRLSKAAQGLSQFGTLETLSDKIKHIENVTLDSVKATAAKLLKTRPTVVAIGGNIHAVPTADTFQSKLR
jgi:predicted Zn-dependent peptidase